MMDKIKKLIKCNMSSNLVTLIILLVLGILIFKESYMLQNKEMIIFQGFIFIGCLVNFYIIVRNLIITYKKISSNFETAEELKDIIINSNPCGIVTLDKDGIVEFLNPTAKNMYGSNGIIGYNVLEMDTIKNTSLHKAIYEGLQGTASQVLNLEYSEHFVSEKKILNVNINPVFESDNSTVKKVILIFNDITKETSLKNEVEATNMSTLKALAHLVDARDDYTGRHSSSVMRYTEILCNCLNLSEEEKEKIIISANLHDIGKIGIDDSILKKEGSLTESEYNKMKLHPVIGASIIGDINGFEEIGKIIKHHHEKYDGNGYPEGLKGEEIPLGSQIIAIADTFDAITTNRVYRKSLGYHSAVRILTEEKDKQFNSYLVNMFLKKIKEIHIENELEHVG